MRPVIRIGEKAIGQGHPTFVIAEVGCNHENDFDQACALVVSAAKAGADAVKFQSFSPENLVTRDAPKFWDIPGPGKTQYEEFDEAKPKFTLEEYRELISLAQKHKILFFSTACDESWADFLDELDVPMFKISSMDVTHLPLLQHVASKGKPVVLSTGASYLKEIQQAVDVIQAEENDQIVLLHCISRYPTQPHQVNLRMMDHLKNSFPNLIVGYSDHTRPDLPLIIPSVAVAAGAQVIEKHFTFDASRPGYDHEISADEARLSEMVAQFREIEQALGGDQKQPLTAEEGARRFGRRSVVARMPIPKGKKIEAQMLAIKRPGTGIEPRLLNQLLGKVAQCDIREDQILTWEVLE